MAIKYYNNDCKYTLPAKRFTRTWIEAVVKNAGREVGDISIVLCSDSALLEVNRQFLQHDYLTDIITFEYTELGEKAISGDLMISIDTVRSNAKEYGCSTLQELNRVVIHGILHLLGQGDKSEKEAKQMREREEQALLLRADIIIY